MNLEFAKSTMESDLRSSAWQTDAASSGLTTMQWLVCAIAGLGFAFDLYESLMNALIVGPVLSTLGNMRPGSQAFNLWVGLFFFLPAVAGGLFGLLGGFLTDIFGRRRLLIWSILLYGFSACAAGFANSLTALLVLRCATLIGISVEAVAAIAWLAELFPIPRQRESVLGYTQACYPLGGLMVSGAYYLFVTYADRMPAIYGRHEAWRYTLLSGLIPAIPLMLVRPFLPESPLWRERTLKSYSRPHIMQLLRPEIRGTTLLTALIMACTLALPYGALQHTPRIVPGLLEQHHFSSRQVQQMTSLVFLIQEMGSITGRALFALLVIRIARSRYLLRLFLAPAFLIFVWLFFFAAHEGLVIFAVAAFCAQALFNGMHSFWGNYLPRVFPTHLRGTGESFAMNIGGRIVGVSGAVLTTQLSIVMPGSTAMRLATSAGVTAVLVIGIALVASSWLHEPKTELPE